MLTEINDDQMMGKNIFSEIIIIYMSKNSNNNNIRNSFIMIYSLI